MDQDRAYFEQPSRVLVEHQFPHVMAIALNPQSNYKEGLIRCIVSREGDVHVAGYIDRSLLYTVSEKEFNEFVIGQPLVIQNETQIIEALSDEGLDYLGLEDPDLWVDQETGLLHAYFTIPFISRDPKKHTLIHLGHAVGKSLETLVMTMPVLHADSREFQHTVAKELAIAPVNSQGIRYNLFEGVVQSTHHSFECSSVQVAKVRDMGGSWGFDEVAFHPEKEGIPWIGGHASPGPLLPRSFIDIGENKLVGFINGREANQEIDGQVHYGIFSVGLFVYDYEYGKIEWVSPEPFIRDSEAKYITFASQFIETTPGRGVLYAHVDDSFMRVYTLNAEEIRKYITAQRGI